VTVLRIEAGTPVNLLGCFRPTSLIDVNDAYSSQPVSYQSAVDLAPRGTSMFACERPDR